ncbi:hypothetical protein BDV98DRAFT_569649 [Pterulicium gracile]|uniref:Uncharacterized protein n=1 Tax=Pterulicium gracile TaxID=1884261 RepID=A0A5C3QE69_9AGAR|nr:hypothetical protein BDV98DRAFT_569649 [Pterula gracilis]
MSRSGQQLHRTLKSAPVRACYHLLWASAFSGQVQTAIHGNEHSRTMDIDIECRGSISSSALAGWSSMHVLVS